MKDPILTQLDLVEQQFNQVAAFLADGEALQLLPASEAIQSLSVQLAKLLQSSSATPAMQKAVRQRVKFMAAGMQMLRDNLSRRAAYNDQSLSVLVPTPVKSTYSSGSSVYGSVARQSGQIRHLAA